MGVSPTSLAGNTMKHWNKCDICGRFISFKDFNNGAINIMVLPESELTKETYETLCIKHNKENTNDRCTRSGKRVSKIL